MSRTAFVAGASGFLGTHFACQPDGPGREIHAWVRPASSLDGRHAPRLQVPRGDSTDEGAVLEVARAHVTAYHRAKRGKNDLLGARMRGSASSSGSPVKSSTGRRRELDGRITPLRLLVQDTVAWLWKAGLMT